MKTFIALALCGLSLLAPRPALADGPETAPGGPFGGIRLGIGLLSARPSGLEVLDDNDRLTNLGDGGGRQTEVLPLVGGELGYRWAATGTTLALGAGFDGLATLSLRQAAGRWGSVTLGLLHQETKVWEDPYRAGADRSRTDARSSGLALGWEELFGAGGRFFVEQRYVDVEEDRRGELDPDLARDGRDTTLGAGYAWDLGPAGTLEPSLSHTWIDRDGTANSGCRWDFELAHTVGLGRLTAASRLGVARTRLDGKHPVFGKERRETAWLVSETVVLAEPFGFANWTVFGYGAYQETIAGIDFFASSGLVLGSGVGYRF